MSSSCGRHLSHPSACVSLASDSARPAYAGAFTTRKRWMARTTRIPPASATPNGALQQCGSPQSGQSGGLHAARNHMRKRRCPTESFGPEKESAKPRLGVNAVGYDRRQRNTTKMLTATTCRRAARCPLNTENGPSGHQTAPRAKRGRGSRYAVVALSLIHI